MKDRSIFNESIFTGMFVVLGGIIIWTSYDIGLGQFQKPGAGFLPFGGGLLVLIMSVANLLISIRKQKEPLFEKGEIKTFFLMNLVFLSWIVAMPYLGYVIVTFLVSLIISKIMKLEGLVKPFILASGTAIFIYLLFDYWLYLDLPRGFWD